MVITLTPNRVIIRISGVGIHFARAITVPYARISDGIPVAAIDSIIRIIVSIVVGPRVKIGSGVVPPGGLSPAWVVVGVGFRIAVGPPEEVGGGGGSVALVFAPVGGLCSGVIAVGAAGGGVVGVVSQHVVETRGAVSGLSGGQ